MIIREAVAADASALAALVNAAYRGPGAMRGWANEAGLLEGQRTNAAMVGDIIAAPPGVILILRAAEGDDPLGCVAITPGRDPERWSLGMLTVDPARQAGGHGRMLMRAAEAFARQHGARRVAMTVIASRATLIAWYERCGYARTGEVEPFPYEDERFGRPLRDDLFFVVLERTIEGDGGAGAGPAA